MFDYKTYKTEEKMGKTIIGIILGVLLVTVNGFAANGNLLVDGNLGIGTTNPGATLDLYSNAQYQPQLMVRNDYSGSGAGYIFLRKSRSGGPVQAWEPLGTLIFQGNDAASVERSAAWIYAQVGSSVGTGYVSSGLNFITTNTAGVSSAKMSITSEGNVGIGTATPAYLLQLYTDSAAKPSTSTWAVASDSRLKTNIQPYTKGLKEILQINPVTYQYNGKGGIGQHIVATADPVTGNSVDTVVVDTALLSKINVGVIAQDIQAVVPEAVTSHRGKINDNDTVETDILDFNSHSLTFILINAIKDLKSQIDSLNQQIAVLKAKVK